MGRCLGFWALAVGLIASTGLASADEGEEIWTALLKTPPVAQGNPSEARQQAVQALDAWIAQPNSEQSPECVAYYRRAVDRVIHLLKTERPKKGVRIFQLYSSSVIVQSPSCAFSIDLDQGPNENLHKTPEEEGAPFCMTDEQVDSLAALIDCAFYTHEHGDHIDYETVKALLSKGKTVVTTESNKRIWAGESWSDAIVVPNQTLGKGQKVGELDVDVLWDHQWNNSAHESGTPCNAYVITVPEGVTIATKGDINCALQLYGWLHVLVEEGRKVDVMVGSPIYWRGVTLTRQIDALLEPLWIPGHNWEFGHRPAGEARGNASAFGQSAAALTRMAVKGDAVALTWGEYVDVVGK